MSIERKLMTITATEYCEMQGKKLSDYTAHGIMEHRWTGLTNEITDEVEAVVGFRIMEGKPQCIECTFYYGTALVPKRSIENEQA